MAKPLNTARIAEIIKSCLCIGRQKTADEFGVSKQYVHRIFKEKKSILLFDYEIFDECGNERNFKELHRVFNNWQRV